MTSLEQLQNTYNQYIGTDDPNTLSSIADSIERAKNEWISAFTPTEVYQKADGLINSLRSKSNQLKSGAVSKVTDVAQTALDTLGSINYGGNTNLGDVSNVGNAKDAQFLQNLNKNQDLMKQDIMNRKNQVIYPNATNFDFNPDVQKAQGLKDYVDTRFTQDQSWQSNLAKARSDALSGKIGTVTKKKPNIIGSI